MGVVEERATLRVAPCRDRGEFIRKRSAGLDRLLRNVRHTVHRVRYRDPVPMHRRRLREAVLHLDPNALAVGDTDLRPGNDAVVRPCRDSGVVEDLPAHWLRFETEHPDAVLNGVRQRRAAGVRGGVRHAVHRSRRHVLRHRSAAAHRHPAHRTVARRDRVVTGADRGDKRDRKRHRGDQQRGRSEPEWGTRRHQQQPPVVMYVQTEGMRAV